MDKKEFFEETLRAVKMIPIVDVAESRMELRKEGSTFKALCPYHDDRKIGSFVLGNGRFNTFKCFACGESGDAVDLVKKLDNISPSEALFRVALEYGLVANNQVDAYYRKGDRSEFQFDYSKNYKVIEERARNTISEVKPDMELLNRVYTLFSKGSELIGKTRLTERHVAYLKEVRELTDEDIEAAGFFSFPERDVLDVLRKELYEQYGYRPDALMKVPGFYGAKDFFMDNPEDYGEPVDAHIPVCLFNVESGIGIPIRNAAGEIEAIQIRLDELANNGLRFRWFSSTWTLDDDRLHDGLSSGAPKDVTYPKVRKNTTVFITEGKFKAMQIAKTFKSVAISIQGVSSWRGVEDVINDIQKHPQVDGRLKHIMIAYDADMLLNLAVMDQTIKLVEACHETLQMDVNIAIWDEQDGKGIDDLILNGKTKTLQSVPYEAFKAVMDKFEKELMDTFGKKKIPREMSEQYQQKLLHYLR